MLKIIIWGKAKEQLILKTFNKEKFSSELCRQDSIPQLKYAILGTSRRLETSFFTNLFLACGTEIIVWLSFQSVGGIPGIIITQITKAQEDSETLDWLSLSKVLEVRGKGNCIIVFTDNIHDITHILWRLEHKIGRIFYTSSELRSLYHVFNGVVSAMNEKGELIWHKNHTNS